MPSLKQKQLKLLEVSPSKFQYISKKDLVLFQVYVNISLFVIFTGISLCSQLSGCYWLYVLKPSPFNLSVFREEINITKNWSCSDMSKIYFWLSVLSSFFKFWQNKNYLKIHYLQKWRVNLYHPQLMYFTINNRTF